MIKVSKPKSRTFLQNFRFDDVQVVWKWREEKSFKGEGEGRGAFLSNKIGQTSLAHVWGACATRDQRAGWAVWHTASTRGGHAMAFGHGASPAHLSHSSAVFGHPNSEFESVFGLWTVTPSCTTKTMKIWQMVENSSRKTTTNTTQRMRTKRKLKEWVIEMTETQ